MVGSFKSLALAAALALVAAPAFAQDMNLNPLGLPLVPNSLNDVPVVNGQLDLDPLHLFTPAAAPAAPAAAPAMHHHMMMHHHHMMMHHHHMMMHHMMKKKAM